ncbi:MAG: hypothetical protein OXO54_01270 [Chloroflexota bacterium]|nr:hypothetical protein [Chloroflexota bacterium]MDE2896932.1 hypothetical protein [Chloroflexota bacterium]
MSRPDPLSPPPGLPDPFRLLEPLGAAVSTVAQPGALAIGLGVGTIAGALAGLAGGLVFIRSPAALVVGPLGVVLVLALWSCALGAGALVADRASDERDVSARRALRDACRQAPALVLASLPILLVVGALAVVQTAGFGFTRPPDTVITTERPVALIAAVFIVLFLIDAIVLAGVNVFLWTVIPHVIVAGRPAGAAYNDVLAGLRERPAWTITSMAGVLILAGTVTGVGLGGVVLALAAVSATQLAGATELVLLRFYAPLVQGSFAVSGGDFVAVVMVFTGLGAAIGAVTGLGHMFGVAGGTGLLRASANSTH